ncbi:hypothetical protein [Echinimonas agarilytica]|uniref:Nucleotidyltransferase n=1 Tax=Echinimonas agarilytica TaxID=1215918 RepID=A0AA41WAT7_9GAMM|nr:hypothetical protein [Echinimonas agarilytica]MCM2681407.1 hypothetical protein [Echinimonas agarilytica]
MTTTVQLHQRLEQISVRFSTLEHAVALIGLGSIGLEHQRFDQYSDLDFFAVVERGYKSRTLSDLSWLTECSAVAYQFFNTKEGCKLMFADEVFCEFAVFEEHELADISFSPGRLVWSKENASSTLAFPIKRPRKDEAPDTQWLIGEALTNLYVGMQRELRGEHLSAMRFIQCYALDRVVELYSLTHGSNSIDIDDFDISRRLEQRFPELLAALGSMLQGYHGNAASTLSILKLLETMQPVNVAMATIIRRQCALGINDTE